MTDSSTGASTGTSARASTRASTASSTAAREAARHRLRLTTRGSILALVVGILVVAYAWPVREYVRQQQELAGLRAEQQRTTERIAALETVRDRWSDPSYVAEQARLRLHYVRPGETAYVTLGNAPRAGDSVPPELRPEPQPQAWFDTLWASTRAADEAQPGSGGGPTG